MTREEAMQIIENMPISHECREFFGLALEALRQPEIVRCKDCKNAEVIKWLDNAIICKKHSYTGVRPDEFYCADGERQEGR